MNPADLGDTAMLGKEPKLEEELPEEGASAEAPPSWPACKRARRSGQGSPGPLGESASRPSPRRPLFSISHRILERRSAPTPEEPAQPDLPDRNGSEAAGLHPLMEKMFFILNSLNSSVTQLHSKVDLLTLEVLRIKKRVHPAEPVSHFQPPPEYLLTREELQRLKEQTSGAGELGCRLLLQLFPELFRARDCPHRPLEALHLQLIRNYVEACYPSVRTPHVWQDQCLVQLNHFFDHFWAQRDSEGPRSAGGPVAPKVECPRPSPEERLTPDRRQSGQALAGLALQATQELDDFSSPEDLVLFLLRRLLPEAQTPDPALSLDPDRMKTIVPDAPDDNWLQVRLEEAPEAPHSSGSEVDPALDPALDQGLTRFPEDAARLPDPERGSRRATQLPPVDFDSLEMGPPSVPGPQDRLLTREQLRTSYAGSSSVGNFASRLLVLLFPEFFGHERRLDQDGSPGQQPLDPFRVGLLRHYVQLVYPAARNDRVWTREFVGNLNERCQRRDAEPRKSVVRRVSGPDPDSPSQLNPEILGEEADAPSAPPERSTKDFCKVPLDELTVSVPDFPVPPGFLLSSAEVRDIVQQSLSVGNFAARLLVRLFPELFTQENLRLQYNHSGACNKKQLDPVRLRLIRHYVESVFPVDKMEEVWHYECVPSIDERCRRPNRKKCDILKKAKRTGAAPS